MQYINLKDKYNFIQPTQDFLEGHPIWRVTLSDGDNIVMDYKESPGSWERLYNYCKESKLYIKNMWIGFRDNGHSLPADKDGYYFCRGVRGSWGMTETMQFFFVGWYENGILYIEKWLVPEMLKDECETRNPKEAGVRLIVRPDIEI